MLERSIKLTKKNNTHTLTFMEYKNNWSEICCKCVAQENLFDFHLISKKLVGLWMKCKDIFWLCNSSHTETRKSHVTRTHTQKNIGNNSSSIIVQSSSYFFLFRLFLKSEFPSIRGTSKTCVHFLLLPFLSLLNVWN